MDNNLYNNTGYSKTGYSKTGYSNTGIHSLLEPFGLLLIGSTRVTDENRVPDIAKNVTARQLLLVGNGGSSFWPECSDSQVF